MQNTTTTKTESKHMHEEIISPDGVSFSRAGNIITVKGKNGEVSRMFADRKVIITLSDNKIILETGKKGKRDKKTVGTMKAHIKNMMKGATEGHSYTLKICSGHFPMNVSIADNTLIIKNFLGEKVPRKVVLKNGATVKVDGQMITVESINKETAGQVAADIEQLTRLTNRDRRIFQDGIYIINKDGKDIK